MPIQYRIQADVVDIRHDRVRSSDRFLVDTNVWFWTAYPYGAPLPYQEIYYLPYVQQAKSSSVQLYYSNLSLAELAHLIEKSERDVYSQTQQQDIETKAYRHNYPAERTNVVTQIRDVWNIVHAFAQTLPTSVDDTATDAALARMPTEALDGYDLFIVEAMSSAGISQVITDDGDYVTVAGIQVFTANRNVLDQALAQGKLLTR